MGKRIVSQVESPTPLPDSGGPRTGSVPVLLAAFAAAVAVVCSAPADVCAQERPEPAPIVVFELEGDDASSELRDELTAAVRAQVQGNDQYELVNDDPVVLSDVVVVLGCESQSTNCLEKAADHFGAAYLIFGKVEDVEERTRVSVRLFDPEKGRYVRSFGRVMSKLEEPYAKFRSEVDEILTTDTQRAAAVLQVSSDVKGATVELNGETVGTTPIEQHEIEPGTYRVVVSSEDGRSWSTKVDVEKGANVRIRAPLRDPAPDRRAGRESESSSDTSGALGGREKSSSRRESDSGASWGPWVAIGVGGLALVGSGIEAAVMQDATSDLREWRSTHRSSADGCRGKECDIIERGENAELAHRILLGVGGASLAGGLLWLWLDNVGGDDAKSARRLELSVTPQRVSVGWRW